MFDRDYPTNKFDKMKHVAKKARKFGSAFAKLAVKSGMQNFTIDGKEVKEQDIGEADGDETRRKLRPKFTRGLLSFWSIHRLLDLSLFPCFSSGSPKLSSQS